MFDWITYLIIIVGSVLLCCVTYRLGYMNGARRVLNDWRRFNEETDAIERNE